MKKLVIDTSDSRHIFWLSKREVNQFQERHAKAEYSSAKTIRVKSLELEMGYIESVKVEDVE